MISSTNSINRITSIEACGVKASVTPTRSVGSSAAPTISLSPIPSPSASPPETSNSFWIWIVLGLVAVVIVVSILLAIGGFIFYKKRKMDQYNNMLDN